MVKDINPGPAASSPRWLTVMDGKLYFTASDGRKRIANCGSATAPSRAPTYCTIRNPVPVPGIPEALP